MALDALLDPDIDLVILTGAAGSGKTLLAMAAALEQTVERKMFDKIIVTRNTLISANRLVSCPARKRKR